MEGREMPRLHSWVVRVMCMFGLQLYVIMNHTLPVTRVLWLL